MFGIQLMQRDVLAFQKESLLRDLAPLTALMTWRKSGKKSVS